MLEPITEKLETSNFDCGSEVVEYLAYISV